MVWLATFWVVGFEGTSEDIVARLAWQQGCNESLGLCLDVKIILVE